MHSHLVKYVMAAASSRPPPGWPASLCSSSPGTHYPHLTEDRQKESASHQYNSHEVRWCQGEPTDSDCSARLGGSLPTSEHAVKSGTAILYFSKDCSSESCTCWHLAALHLSAFPSFFPSVFCMSFHRLQWQTRCFPSGLLSSLRFHTTSICHSLSVRTVSGTSPLVHVRTSVGRIRLPVV